MTALLWFINKQKCSCFYEKKKKKRSLERTAELGSHIGSGLGSEEQLRQSWIFLQLKCLLCCSPETVKGTSCPALRWFCVFLNSTGLGNLGGQMITV